mmetsp:Transcript_28498/g.43630  ORF Transcript_28498/g.43630 Transcript_28498/m.43630 type:complete len:196 (-) Transcript_28498:343-930(-)|eukprot:CAMPEP_0194073836 /NCGR_PEP_ID=MMETSP0149-20130528/1083_1 /TAXON_ID=122233 /ORGANISM="Chaetoceros debilis, Strain MM31A-1" /LENGTH=195 /DNA_ID=CAMNT_0038753881 /DNA_START=107 /DNA_END=694 /DNA_ORIENTATION=+
MKTAAILSLFAASATAFAPAPSSKATTAVSYSSELDNMIGATVEVGGKPWDPLNVSDYIPADYARKCELANGRSAMLATVGYVFPKWFGAFEGTVSVDDPIAAIGQADLQWWAQFVIFCGTIEAYKYRMELEGKTSTGGEGEPAIDWMRMYPEDPAERKVMQEKELKNGRLAMLGIAGFVSAHFAPAALPIGPGF